MYPGLNGIHQNGTAVAASPYIVNVVIVGAGIGGLTAAFYLR